MNPLIILLLFVLPVQAQSLADLARQERARKAALQSVRVFTIDNLKGNTDDTAKTAPETETPPGTSSAVPDPKPLSPVPASVPPAAKAVEDAAKKYADQLARLRTKVIELQDREMSLQLQLNDVKNQFFSPVTDTTTRAQAQTKMEQTQTQLKTVQKELTETRRLVQQMEAQGPPKLP